MPLWGCDCPLPALAALACHNDSVEERHELVLILVVAATGLKIHRDGCAKEQGDHCEVGSMRAKCFNGGDAFSGELN